MDKAPHTAYLLPSTVWQCWRLRLLALSWFAAFVLGAIGFQLYHPDSMEASGLLNSLYHAAQLCILHAPHFDRVVPWPLEIGRWLAVVSLIMTGTEVARRMFHDERNARKLNSLSRHAVVCGLGQKGYQEVLRLCASGSWESTWGKRRRIVVLDKDPAPDLAQACRKMGVDVFTGDATRAESLRVVHVERAVMLFALLPDDEANCEIAAQVCEIRSDIKKSMDLLTCHIHLGDRDLRDALQRTLANRSSPQSVAFEFVDVFDLEARRLLIHDIPLDYEGICATEPRHVHLVILGFGRMGRTLALRAAQLGHFANGKRLKISVIDRRPDLKESLLFRYPRLLEVCDVDFHTCEAESPQARSLIEQWANDTEKITSLALCFDDERRALSIASQLMPVLKAHGVRMAVRMARKSGLAHLLARPETAPALLSQMIPFGLEESINRPDRVGWGNNEKFAITIHGTYVNMKTQEAGGKADTSEDAAVREWNALDEDLRESNRQQADHIFIKLRAIGCDAVSALDDRLTMDTFTEAEVEMLAELEHRRWNAERILAGWTYVPGKKSIENKTNPNILPWEQLTEEIKDYDRKAVRKIPSLLKSVSIKVCRRQVS